MLLMILAQGKTWNAVKILLKKISVKFSKLIMVQIYQWWLFPSGYPKIVVAELSKHKEISREELSLIRHCVLRPKRAALSTISWRFYLIYIVELYYSSIVYYSSIALSNLGVCESLHLQWLLDLISVNEV